MKINEVKTLVYRIELTEEEVDSLVSCLSMAKSDWNISDITIEILNKLRNLKQI